MPAYDRPIVINTPRENRRSVAATIRFSSNDMARIKDYLDRMEKAGVIKGYEVGEYDCCETSPALYFP